MSWERGAPVRTWSKRSRLRRMDQVRKALRHACNVGTVGEAYLLLSDAGKARLAKVARNELTREADDLADELED